MDDKLYLPKTDILNILKTLPYSVGQPNQTVFSELPTITFLIDDNTPLYGLKNEILSQTIRVIIHMWAEDSVTASTMLKEIEALMRQNGYLLKNSKDIPNIDNSVYHLWNVFETKIG